MAWKTMELRLSNDPTSPGLLIHNGRLADPMNPFTKDLKKISGKRNKTDADFVEIAHLEFLGGLYWTEELGPHIPGMCLEASFKEAARKLKKGKLVESGVIINTDWPIEYDGPRDAEELWNDERFRLTVGVRVQRNRVMRCRPLFRDWAIAGTVGYEDTIINPAELKDIVKIAGSVIGLCEWRPKFGRYVPEF